MKMLRRPMLSLVLLLVAAVNTGCASFAAGRTEKAVIPPVAEELQRPAVYLDVKFFQGKPDAKGREEIGAVKEMLQAIVGKVADESGLFSEVTFDPFQQGSMDQVIQLYFYNHGDTGAATLFGFISGFTFGVIPAAATDKYTLTTAAFTPQAAVASTADMPRYSTNDEVTTWIGIWFLPLAGKTPEKAVTRTFETMTRDGLRQLLEGNHIKLVKPAPPPPPHPEVEEQSIVSIPLGEDATGAIQAIPAEDEPDSRSTTAAEESSGEIRQAAP